MLTLNRANRAGGRRSAGNAIRGPHSALTDFLAAHNISAQQIQQDYQNRLNQQNTVTDDAEEVEDENNSNNEGEDPVERKKRKRKEEKAIAKIKASKEFKRAKYEHRDIYGSDAEEDDDVLARGMLHKTKPRPKPGQLENCDLCEKRFTVTPYSMPGPTGGLMCIKCSKVSKDQEKKAKADENKKKRITQKGRKRQTESDRMMGDVKPGAKSLVDHCVRRIANVVHDIDEFGDMPQNLLDRLSQILSKQRVIDSRILKLFFKPELDRISVYDCGKLETEDFLQLFAFMSHVTSINLRFAGQMKNDSLLYMVDKCTELKHLQLGATNLISDKSWIELFKKRGAQLESLKLSELNDSLTDETMAVMGEHCSNLRRLKLRSCLHMGEGSIHAISQLKKLERLSLAIAQDSSPDTLVTMINKLGPNLKTLSLEDYTEADDTVLEAIKESCNKLTKLRLTGNCNFSDTAFTSLFDNNWGNPSLTFVDFSSNRDIDNANPDGPGQNPIGFGSGGLQMLMRHSGPKLEHLDLHSCRHMTHEALLDVFDGEKQYPQLQDVDLSFVTYVDDVIVMGVFKSCPKLRKLALFACFSARGMGIPTGVAVIGLPNAQDNVVVEGDIMEGF